MGDCRGWAPGLDGRLPATRWLCRQAQELVGGERQHAEHAVAHHLCGATDADMATAELVLETAIDALTRRTLVVANLLGELEAEIGEMARTTARRFRSLRRRVRTKRGRGTKKKLVVTTDTGRLNPRASVPGRRHAVPRFHDCGVRRRRVGNYREEPSRGAARWSCRARSTAST